MKLDEFHSNVTVCLQNLKICPLTTVKEISEFICYGQKSSIVYVTFEDGSIYQLDINKII